MANDRLDATGLVNILTDLYKTKDTKAKVDKDTFQTAFEEANANGSGVTTKDLLEQIKTDTGIAIEDFSKDEQEAINQTLSALSDDKDSFDSYQDLVDISQEYYDELESSKALSNINYVISSNDSEVLAGVKLNNEVSPQASEEKAEETKSSDNSGYIAVKGKGHDYGDKGYAQLVRNGDDYKMQVCLPDGKVVTTRELSDKERKEYGLEIKANDREGFDDCTGSDKADGSKASEDNTEALDSDNKSVGTTGTDESGEVGGATQTEDIATETDFEKTAGDVQKSAGDNKFDLSNLSPEMKTEVQNLINELNSADAKEGIFGKIGGAVKNLFNTKYSTKNIEAKLQELINKGENLTKADIENFKNEYINPHQKKSGGASEKAGNAGAVVGGIAAGTAAVSAAVAAGILSAPVSVPAIILGVGVAVVGGALSKIGIKQLDKATNQVDNDAMKKDDLVQDGVSGGFIGAASYGIAKTGVGSIVKGIGATLKTAGSAVVNSAKSAAGKVTGFIKGSSVAQKVTSFVKSSAQGASRAGIGAKITKAFSNGKKVMGSFIKNIFKKSAKASTVKPSLVAGSMVKAALSETDTKKA